MNHYQPPSHGPAFALVAVALAALTIGAFVVVPASVEPAARVPAVVAVAPLPTAVVVSPARIDIVAVREAKVAAEGVRVAPPKRGRSS